MASRASLGRSAIAGALALTALAISAPAASAVGGFHFIKIREVFIGGGNSNAAFVELQAYANGQANIAGHSVSFYDETGVLLPGSPYVLTTDVANGDNQRSVLLGGPGVTPAPDFSYDIGTASHTYGPGGAVCFDNLDCVSWGSFAGALPSATGANAPAIPNGSSLERSIAVGCATLLEDFDDTDSSQADFFLQPSPNPRNNAATPTEQSCLVGPGDGPETRLDSGPRRKTGKRRAVFKFSSTSVGVTCEYSRDGKAPNGGGSFGACASPFSVKVKRGKHDFRVRAVLGGVPDATPAGQTWRVKKPKR
jgi:hypothetical protein